MTVTALSAGVPPVVLHGVTRLPDRAVVDVIVRDGRIERIERIARGSGGEPARGAGRAGQVLDARGLFLLPGFEDAHVHMVQWATRRQRIDLHPATSAAHAASIVRAALADRPAEHDPLEVVVGFGFRDALWPDLPTAALLDRATGPRPVLLQSNDLHTAWLNPAALHLLGRDPDDGLLREADCYAAVAALSPADAEAEDRATVAATAAAATRGVTSILDFEFSDTITDWTRRAAQRELSTRITCVVPAHLGDAVGARGLRTGDALAGGLLRVGPLKLFADGSLNSRTAFCHEPYASAGLLDPPDHGCQVLGPDELAGATRAALRHGLQPAVHAIGDAAVAAALDVFEELDCAGRIEHAQLVAEADLPRFARPGLLVGVQPAHAPEDRDVADRHWRGRTHRAFAYADLLAAGARLRIGSDAPNVELDPWQGIASAVCRTGDERAPWHPEQQIPLGAALAASCGGRTTVAAGDPADLILLEQDPWSVSARELREMPVAATMMAGRWTHVALAGR